MFRDAAEIRAEIAKAAPNYDGIQHLSKQGDVFQWGGAWLCEGGVCPTPDGRGRLLPIDLPEQRKPEGHFLATTRRGKQFNSMIYSEIDPFNGAGRHDVLISHADMDQLGLKDGEAIVVYNRNGVFHGRARRTEGLAAGNIELYWPEGNMLFPKGVYEPYAGIPEYNTAVIVEKADTYFAMKDTRYVEKRIEELEMDLPG
jgi:anaerobic selenocysteine-containing dehydrogenase